MSSPCRSSTSSQSLPRSGSTSPPRLVPQVGKVKLIIGFWAWNFSGKVKGTKFTFPTCYWFCCLLRAAPHHRACPSWWLPHRRTRLLRFSTRPTTPCMHRDLLVARCNYSLGDTPENWHPFLRILCI
jgi:hypothetical protein